LSGMEFMVDRRSWMMGVGCVLALLAPVSVVAAESDQLLATLDKPAVVTVRPGPERSADQPARVVIIVTGFQPPQNGAVQAVVKAQREGTATEPEIGRFGIFPNTRFKVADPAKGQRFGFPLPKELAGRGPVKLTVQLVPLRGEGKGASLELGGAELRL
jgi:hypothetical protein